MLVKDILIKTNWYAKKKNKKNFNIYSKGARKMFASNLLKIKKIL